MAKFEKNKLQKTWEKVHNDQNNIASLNKIDPTRSDVYVNKKVHEIILVKSHLVSDDEQYAHQQFTLSYFLKNFKEWMLPYFHPLIKIYTTPAYIVNDRLVFNSSYYWQQVPNGFNFHLSFGGNLTNIPGDTGSGGGGIIIFRANPPVTVPLYLDVKLFTFNDNVWQEVQQLKD